MALDATHIYCDRPFIVIFFALGILLILATEGWTVSGSIQQYLRADEVAFGGPNNTIVSTSAVTIDRVTGKLSVRSLGIAGVVTGAGLDVKVSSNAAISPGTGTKITYDAKGLVTAGTSATTADIADSAGKRYTTEAQQTLLGNTSGANSGDQDLSGYAIKTTVATSTASLTTSISSLATAVAASTATFTTLSTYQTISGSKTFTGTVNISSGVNLSGSAGTSGQTLTSGGPNTIPTWTTPSSGGPALNIVVSSRTTVFSTTSSAYQDTGLSVIITPSATTAKIFVQASGTFSNVAAPGVTSHMTLFRGSGNLGSGASVDFLQIKDNGSAITQLYVPFSIIYLDSPNTTSAVTYSVRIANEDGSSTVRISQNNSLSVIVAQEVH